MCGQCVEVLAAEDGGGDGLQPVAAQVQLLQLLQPCQFATEGGDVVQIKFQISTKQTHQIGLICDLSLILEPDSSFTHSSFDREF